MKNKKSNYRASFVSCIKYAFLLLVIMCVIRPSGAVEAAGSFQESLFASGLNVPTAMEFAPDGRLFVTEQGGALRVIKNGILLPTPFLSVAVDQNGERGLVGIAFDPDFNNNHYLYVYYTVASPVHNRVSRFTANGDVAVAGSELPILDMEPLGATNHNGGAIHFGLDGKLYIGVGNNAVSSYSQTLSNRLGKVLRINPDGTIPNDNPFINTPGAKPEIWAYGLRNPFTFAVDSLTGKIYVNDVGELTWEEVNLLTKGANYGWPNCEGPQNSGVGSCSDPTLTYPLYVYNHAGGGGAITGGTFYRASQFPSNFYGSYFFGDYVRNFLRSIDGSNQAADFLSTAQSPVDTKVGPDGALYYASIFTGNIYREAYILPTNNPPVAAISATPTTGQPPLSVSFSSSGSTDADSDSLTYAWNFGDGSTDTIAAPTHVYTNPGPYTTSLTVSDGRGGSDTKTISIAVGTPPVATILTPDTATSYNAGDTISFSGSGTDADDGDLGASALSWTIVFHHDTHTHPFLGPLTGITSGSFQIPTTGETSANTWYRIHLTVTDSTGLTHEVTRDVTLNKTTLTLNTNISGLSLTLEGQPQASPITFDSVVGFGRVIGAPTFQTLNGSTYAFNSWSDGGSASHTISTPATNTTYTANYDLISSTAYTVAATIPGIIEAENFDNGGEGVAYHDMDTGNNGAEYRTTDVDLKPALNDGGGYALGWFQAGEWLNYNVQVNSTASYTLALRAGSLMSTGRAHVEFDGVDKTGTMVVPNTGDYASWATITKTGINLTAGPHVMRVFADSEFFDLNYISLTQEIPANTFSVITIDHTKIPNTDLTNFPVLISGTYSYLATTANGGKVQNTNGYDVGFYTSNDCTSGKLAWETESYNAATGTVNYWVKIPTLSHTTDTVFYLCYGNASISTDQSSPTNVWDNNFKTVYHLKNGSTLSAADSTSSSNNGTISGAVATAGQIGGAASFNGTTSVTRPSLLSLPSFTVSFWVRGDQAANGSGSNVYTKAFGKFGADTSFPLIAFNWQHNGNNNRACELYLGNFVWQKAQLVTPLAANTWYNIACTYDGITLRAYLNGVQEAQTNVARVITGTGALVLGGDSAPNFAGKIDEFQVSDSVRTADWIAAEYNNQNSPSTFYAVSSGPDMIPPTITNVSSSHADGAFTVGAVLPIDVTFSEPVTSAGSVTVTLETGTTDRTCTFTVSNSSSATCNYIVQAGDTSADLNVNSISGAIADSSNNTLTNFVPTTNLALNKALVIDTTAPTNQDTVFASDTTSVIGGAVSVVSAGDATANIWLAPATTTTFVAGTTMTTASGTASSINAPVMGGVYKLFVIDAAGNISAASIAKLTVDGFAPTISNITSGHANGAFTIGEVIPIDVTFSEPVTSTGVVTITLETGTTDRTCAFTVSNSNSATCNYTVQSGDVSSSLNVNTISGSIKDQNGNAMTNFVPANNLASNKSIVIDAFAPTVTNITSTHVNGSFTVGEVIPISVTFSEAVTSTGNITVTLETGTVDRTCTFTVSNSNSATCNYTVQAGDTSTDLTVNSISGALADQANNALNSTLPAANLGANKAIVIDTTVPTITNVTSTHADGSFTVGIVLSINVTFSEPVTSTGNITVTLETGTVDRTCTFTLSNSTTGSCNYTVQTGDTSADLNVNTIGGTMKDQTGNAMTNFVPVINLAANKALVIDTTAPNNQNTVFTTSTSKAGGTAVAIASSGLATNNVWFAPSATTTFIAGANMTTAGGTATSMLAPATAGSYKLFVIDAAGNISPASTATLTVTDTTAPVLSAIQATSLTTTGATITWTSNEASDSQVQYGLTTSYTLTTTLNTTLVTSHSQSLTGLTTSTLYHYRVKSKDAAGNLATSADFTFTTKGPSTTYLSDMTPISATSGWGPYEKDKSNGEQAAGDGHVLTLNGTTYPKGLGTHAASDIRYTLSNCSTFVSDAGLDDEINTSFGTIVFQVYLDSVLAYDSGTMTPTTATKHISLSLTGKTQLRLVVTNNGDDNNSDHADWAGAKITCG